MTVYARVRDAGRAVQRRAVVAGVLAGLLVAVIALLEQYEPWERYISDVAATHPTDHLLVLIARTPLSTFASAPDLPAWGAIAQVLVLTTLGMIVLGWRRLLLIGLGAQFTTNLVVHALVVSGHAHWLGLHTRVPTLDTGPSVVVVAIAIAITFELPTPAVGTLLCIGFALEVLLLRNLAAPEHLIGLISGIVLWWASRPPATFLAPGRYTGTLQQHRRAMRRATAAAVAIIGVLAIVSALSAPHARVHHRVAQLLPLAAAHVANGVLAAAGVALLILSRGLLRGQRRAWLLSVTAVAMVASSDLARGRHFGAASISLVVLLMLFIVQSSFTAQSGRRSGIVVLRSAVLTLAVAFLATVVAVVALTHHSRHEPRLAMGAAARAVFNALFGWRGQRVTERTAGFLHAGVFGVAAAVAVISVWRALRPALARQRDLDDRRALRQRARDLVERFGDGTLDYFVLRDDKELFIVEDTVVGYMVTFGVCLVSPDPVGPRAQRELAWDAFREFTDRQGWTVAVLAAAAEWLPIYKAYGMRAIYAGDEAVVDSATFHLNGGERKSLRQAVNRVGRMGYSVTFHDPTQVGDELRVSILALMHKSRRGGVERGFSMTLGRVFDPGDTGLLLAVCTGPDGTPAAFCQYAPAPGIRGWSLDLMRRDPADHPNGLIDFVIVETIRHVAAHGGGEVGLNFAAMRAILAADGELGLTTRSVRFVLDRLSDRMQIRSLWHFNNKYGPRWIPRYVAVDGAENTVQVAAAIGKAESMWELPVVGRWMGPRGVEVGVGGQGTSATRRG